MKHHIVKAALVIATTLTSVSAFAENHFRISCWKNETQSVVHGKFNWGNGSFTYFTVEPGRTYNTWIDIRSQDELHIAFDGDPYAGFFERTYTLRTFAIPVSECTQGPTEAFRMANDGTIDLYRVM